MSAASVIALVNNAAKLKFPDRFLWFLRVEVFDDCEQLGVYPSVGKSFRVWRNFKTPRAINISNGCPRSTAPCCRGSPEQLRRHPLSRTKFRSQVKSLLSNKLASSHQIRRPRAAS